MEFREGDRVRTIEGENGDRDGNPRKVPAFGGGVVEKVERGYAYVRWFKGDPEKCVIQSESWHPTTHLEIDPMPVAAPTPFYPPPTYRTPDGVSRPKIPPSPGSPPSPRVQIPPTPRREPPPRVKSLDERVEEVLRLTIERLEVNGRIVPPDVRNAARGAIRAKLLREGV